MNNSSFTIFDDDDKALRWQFTAYLKVVTYHAKVDYIRKYVRQGTTMPIENTPESALMYEQTWRYGSSGFDFEDQKLAEVFSGLPQNSQQLLTLIFIKGLSPKEVASELKCSVKSVYKQKHHTLKKLRDKLINGGNRHDGKIL